MAGGITLSVIGESKIEKRSGRETGSSSWSCPPGSLGNSEFLRDGRWRCSMSRERAPRMYLGPVMIDEDDEPPRGAVCWKIWWFSVFGGKWLTRGRQEVGVIVQKLKFSFDGLWSELWQRGAAKWYSVLRNSRGAGFRSCLPGMKFLEYREIYGREYLLLKCLLDRARIVEARSSLFNFRF